MTAEGARNADARLVAPVVDGLPEELPSSSGLTTPSFQIARAPRGSSAEYLDSSSPVEDMKRNRPNPKTTKGPHAATESERTAREITPLSPAWCESCTLGRGIEARHVRLTPLERDERPIVAMDFAVRKA